MTKIRSVAGIVLLTLLLADGCSNRTRYDNCEQMRQDHAAPVSQGEANYNPALDKDHDGIACEKSE